MFEFSNFKLNLNSELTQVCFGVAQLQLNFDKNLSLYVTGDFDLFIDDNLVRIKADEYLTSELSKLFGLIGQSIVSVVEFEDFVKAEFNSGNYIKIYLSDNYESIEVIHKEEHYIF